MSKLMKVWDAVIVGAGPNGLAAGVALAQAGRSILVLEGRGAIGGGISTSEVTLPGFRHDTCATVHPTARISPFFKSLDLEKRGVTWLYPEVDVAHPLDGRPAAALYRDLGKTVEGLGADGPAWRGLMKPLLDNAPALFAETLAPVRLPGHWLTMARFGLSALRSCSGLTRSLFRGPEARALFAGCAAHGFVDLDAFGSASFGVMLALSAHVAGWPFARGGSMVVAEALAAIIREHGGEIRVDHPVRSMGDIPNSRAVLFDVMPRNFASIAGDALPADYRAKLGAYRHGPAAFKVDWALSGPIPWRDEVCRRAGTVHLGGTMEELAVTEARALRGELSERPFVLVTQPTLCDPGRAPGGAHIGWAYAHVPARCDVDVTERIEATLERAAPGFRDLIRARTSTSPAALEARNPNLVGGDISGGANDLLQFFARPMARWDPYATPNPRLFLCSSATPPGGGVHGMCGWHAARSALRRVLA